MSFFWLQLLLNKDSVKIPVTFPNSLELMHMFQISEGFTLVTQEVFNAPYNPSRGIKANLSSRLNVNGYAQCRGTIAGTVMACFVSTTCRRRSPWA